MAKDKSEDQKRGTLIHGIAASNALDSSGERIDIEGVDISKLTEDGILNFEHTSNTPSYIVGKILKAKKIFKKSDCENDHHRYFWDKIKIPYIYVMGELFDAVGHQSAKDIAAMLRYDATTDRRETKQLINFSIEGQKLETSGSNILKCIARKVSLTITPCNKTCFAEELKEDSVKKTRSNDFSSLSDILNKNEESTCQIFKAETKKPLKKQILGHGISTTKKPMGELPVGTGNMKAGTGIAPKRTFTQANAPKDMKVGDRVTYPKKSFLPKPTGPKTPNWKKSSGKVEMPASEAVKEHEHLVDVLESKSHKDNKKEAKKQKKELKEYKGKLKNKKDIKVEDIKTDLMKKKKLSKYDSNVRKAIAAGCGMGASSAKVQGDALSKECIKKAISEIGSQALERLSKKEDLIKFLSDKLPKLSKTQITGLAKAVAYTREKKLENKLSSLIKDKDNEQKN